MSQLLLMNPNSSRAVTETMLAIARRDLPGLTGWTALSGPELLTTMADLEAAAALVAAAEIPAGTRGVIVSAFGDPGRKALSDRLTVPVVGIGQAAALAAARGSGQFAVATHTPEFVTAIDAMMRAAAPKGRYLGTFLAQGDPVELAGDAAALDAAFLAAIRRACVAGAGSVIIGGGPLGEAAERLRAQAPCELIAPISEAARRLRTLIRDADARQG